MAKTLAQEIETASHQLLELAKKVPDEKFHDKILDGTGGKVSVSDLISYQIGWGNLLTLWYEKGIKNETISMPGEGFLKWEYVKIAHHFYQKFQDIPKDEKLELFEALVRRILEIVTFESERNNLDAIGIWEWCTLSSGNKWPLSKWIRVNTAAPYKRGIQMMKKYSRIKGGLFQESF